MNNVITNDFFKSIGGKAENEIIAYFEKSFKR